MAQGRALTHDHEVEARQGYDRTPELDLGSRSLRNHAARGTIINSGFQLALAGLGLLQRFIVAAFLTRAEFGLWGIIIVTLLTLLWLKQVGVADKYVQQNEPDQELAFQKAFTIELAMSLAFLVLVVVALPVYAVAYSTPKIILPGLLLSLSVPLTAFESPIWIPYRRMQFVRQRTLSAVDPVTSFVATVALAAAGAGYWALVIGAVLGSLAGATVATLTCPYRLRIRYDRGTLREYVSFSLPLMGLSLTNLVVLQTAMLVSNRVVGLAGIGAIGLASSIASFADGVDGIISQTLYPAVCAAASRRDKLFEAFVKSNRIALIWGMPFGVGLALFAPDLVRYQLGHRWAAATGLIAAFGLIAGFRQVAFNYSIFMRAVNDTKPMLVISLLNLACFVVLGVPLIIWLGLTGYALAFACMTAVQIAARGYYLSRMFSGFRIARHLFRAVAPSVPAAALILGLRVALPLPHQLPVALGELALYVGATVAATAWFEGGLVRELLGYLRGAGLVPARAS
jgi:O-antigen/teichoic acid export membrane protein